MKLSEYKLLLKHFDLTPAYILTDRCYVERNKFLKDAFIISYPKEYIKSLYNSFEFKRVLLHYYMNEIIKYFIKKFKGV